MAPKKRRANVKLFNPIINENQITFESALCPVCRSVLIEPVTLPCGHNFCLACFNGTVNNAALVCPLCRTRISSWLRQARKESNLVNTALWEIIQNKYPTYIDTKLKGNDDCFENNIAPAPRILATPGEIKQEYEKQIALETDQLRREREAEEQKSKELILELQKQEQLAAQLEAEKLKQDEEMARKLAQEEQEQAKILTQNNITPKNRKHGPMDTFIVKSAEIKHQTPKASPPMRKSLFNNNSQNVFQMFSNGLSSREKKQYLLNESVDYMKQILSKENDDVIHQEITHIKPISLVPRTPPKSDKNGIIMESPIIRSTPIRLVQDKIEYNRVKSPNPNILMQTDEHVSAFISTSPNKIENNEDDNNDKRYQVQKILKRISFERDPLELDSKSPTPSSTVINSPAIGSPFIGFKSLANDHCHLTNILHNCFSINNNNNDDIDQTPKSKGKRKSGLIKFNGSEFDEDQEQEIDIILKQKELEEMILQEQKDFEYARKLHEELNREDENNRKPYSLRTPSVKSTNIKYSSTHAMVHRSGGKSRKRQSTIDELCTPKKYKVQ